jgi:hypothetical protein
METPQQAAKDAAERADTAFRVWGEGAKTFDGIRVVFEDSDCVVGFEFFAVF